MLIFSLILFDNIWFVFCGILLHLGTLFSVAVYVRHGNIGLIQCDLLLMHTKYINTATRTNSNYHRIVIFQIYDIIITDLGFLFFLGGGLFFVSSFIFLVSHIYIIMIIIITLMLLLISVSIILSFLFFFFSSTFVLNFFLYCMLGTWRTDAIPLQLLQPPVPTQTQPRQTHQVTHRGQKV